MTNHAQPNVLDAIMPTAMALGWLLVVVFRIVPTELEPRRLTVMSAFLAMFHAVDAATKWVRRARAIRGQRSAGADNTSAA